MDYVLHPVEPLPIPVPHVFRNWPRLGENSI
jgi:hypothetical protein